MLNLSFFHFLHISWFPEVVNVFIDKNMLKHLNTSQADSFYNSVSTLVSNQVFGRLNWLKHEWQHKKLLYFIIAAIFILSLYNY